MSSIAETIRRRVAQAEFARRWPPSGAELERAFAALLAVDSREEETARHLVRALKQSGCRFTACKPAYEVVEPEPFSGEGCDWSDI